MKLPLHYDVNNVQMQCNDNQVHSYVPQGNGHN